MAENIVVIDTETTWSDQVMSLGAIIADGATFRPLDSRYYVIDPYWRMGGMYSDVLHVEGTPREIVCTRKQMAEDLTTWLALRNVNSIFAYNAKFDKNHMPELGAYEWFDILRLAAYKQYNPCIPVTAQCCQTGRMKCGYGVEAVYRMLSGSCRYTEVHNGWFDAMDELKIMEMLGHPLEVYRQIAGIR